MPDSGPRTPARIGATLLTLGLAVAAWFVLVGWTVRGSERFYVLVPPVAAILTVVWTWPDRAFLKRLAWRTFQGTLVAAFLCFGYLLFIGSRMGAAGHKFPVSGWEVICACYFLLSTGILFLGCTKSCEHAAKAAAARWCQAEPATRGQTFWRATVEKGPPMVVMAGMFAWLIAAFNVHRAKLPLVTDPQRSLKLAYEDVTFETHDGHTLRGWFIPAADPKCDRTVIICHGLGANRSMFVALAKFAHLCDANALMFDFRGHGESDGHTVSFGWHEQTDVLTAIDYMRDERPEECQELYGMAVSLGTAAMVRAAAKVEPPLDGVILDSPFTCSDEMAERTVWSIPWPIRPAVVTAGLPIASVEANAPLANLRPVDDIPNLRCPLLIIHTTGDPLIPLQQAQTMFEQAQKPKEILLVESSRHSGAFQTRPGEYARAVQKLLDH